MKVLCVTLYGRILMTGMCSSTSILTKVVRASSSFSHIQHRFTCPSHTDVVGVSHRGEPVTPLDRTSPSSLLISMGFILSHVLTSWSWRVTSGSITDRS